MDEEILKIIEKKINEIHSEDNNHDEIMATFPNFEPISFASGMMIGR